MKCRWKSQARLGRRAHRRRLTPWWSSPSTRSPRRHPHGDQPHHRRHLDVPDRDAPPVARHVRGAARARRGDGPGSRGRRRRQL